MPSDRENRQLQDNVSGDEEIATTFQRLRQEGHSRQEAVRLILDVLDVSLSEAKLLLMSNDTWAEAQSAAGLQSESTGDRGEPSSGDAGDDSIPPAPG